MDRKTNDFTLTCYKSNLWIKQINNLRQIDGKFFHNDERVNVSFVTLFGLLGEFRRIGEQCILYTIDDGTGLIQCRHYTDMNAIDDLEDWDWKDFNVTKNNETLLESSNLEEDSIFNNVTIQPEDRIANRNSRLKLLDTLRWSMINSFRSHEALQVGNSVCIHGRIYSFLGNIQIHVNVIRPITMIEELTLMTCKLNDCGLQKKNLKRKRASGLMTFDTCEETQIRAKPRPDIGLPPSPQIVAGALCFPSTSVSAVTFDTIIPKEEEEEESDDDTIIPATP